MWLDVVDWWHETFAMLFIGPTFGCAMQCFLQFATSFMKWLMLVILGSCQSLKLFSLSSSDKNCCTDPWALSIHSSFQIHWCPCHPPLKILLHLFLPCMIPVWLSMMPLTPLPELQLHLPRFVSAFTPRSFCIIKSLFTLAAWYNHMGFNIHLCRNYAAYIRL